jgi:hypothetical protein
MENLLLKLALGFGEQRALKLATAKQLRPCFLNCTARGGQRLAKTGGAAFDSRIGNAAFPFDGLSKSMAALYDVRAPPYYTLCC